MLPACKPWPQLRAIDSVCRLQWLQFATCKPWPQFAIIMQIMTWVCHNYANHDLSLPKLCKSWPEFAIIMQTVTSVCQTVTSVCHNHANCDLSLPCAIYANYDHDLTHVTRKPWPRFNTCHAQTITSIASMLTKAPVCINEKLIRGGWWTGLDEGKVTKGKGINE